MVQAGKKAPRLKLKDETGRAVRLEDFRGKRVVLYFYPRDLTPGCTIEACEFRDRMAEFEKRGAVVLGVSPDDARSHQRFREKHGLNFPLLTDEEHRTAEAYGAWQEKNMYGRKVWGVRRSTFVIDEEGRVARVFDKVKPEGHTREVIRALDEMG